MKKSIQNVPNNSKIFAIEIAYYEFAYYVAMSHLYHVSLKVLERSTTQLRRKSRLSHI